MSPARSVLNARAFSSLRTSHNYRLYFGGQLVSLTGTWMQNTAMAWLVGAVLTHSARAVGVLAVCQFGPYAILGLFGGVASDRFDRRTMYMATQTAAMVLAAVMTGLTAIGAITLREVYVLAVLLGTVNVLDAPARQTLTMELVGRQEVPNAVALNSSLFNLSRAVGPALAGLIIAGAGVTLCFAINTLSFLAVLISLIVMNTAELHRPGRSGGRPQILRGTVEGLRFAWSSVPIRIAIIMMTLIATLAMNFNVLMPVLATHTLHAGPRIFGALSASFGLGALAGALASATMARADLRIMVAAAAVSGVTNLILAPLVSILASCALLFVMGAAFSLFSSNANATVQLNSPEALRGRVLGVYTYVFFGTAPLGGYLAGWLSEVRGTGLAFVVAGAASLLASLMGLIEVRRRGGRLRLRSGRRMTEISEAEAGSHAV